MKVSQLAPGSVIRLKLLRDGNPREVNIKLGELPNEKETASDGKPENDSTDGLSVENLTPQIARQLELQSNAGGKRRIAALFSRSRGSRSGPLPPT